MPLPDDPGPVSAIAYPGKEESKCCLGVLIFPNSCSESIPGSRLAIAGQPGYFSETLTT